MAEEEGKLPEEPATAALVPAGWRGDDHKIAIQAADEAGLAKSDVELDLYTEGFKAGMTLEDRDGAVVATGRTVLKQKQLEQALAPMLRYLGVKRDAVRVRVHDGTFELRIAGRAAESQSPALHNAKLALQLWVGFGLLGFAVMQIIPGARFASAIIWGVGLMLGAWQLRRGLVSGRAMLGAQLAMGLGILAQEEQLILPPKREDE